MSHHEHVSLDANGYTIFDDPGPTSSPFGTAGSVHHQQQMPFISDLDAPFATAFTPAWQLAASGQQDTVMQDAMMQDAMMQDTFMQDAQVSFLSGFKIVVPMFNEQGNVPAPDTYDPHRQIEFAPGPAYHAPGPAENAPGTAEDALDPAEDVFDVAEFLLNDQADYVFDRAEFAPGPAFQAHGSAYQAPRPAYQAPGPAYHAPAAGNQDIIMQDADQDIEQTAAQPVNDPSKKRPLGFHRTRGGLLNVTPKGDEKALFERNCQTLLLRIPPELRNMIWKLVLGGKTFRCTQITSKKHRFVCEGPEDENRTALLQTCRQTYYESALMIVDLNMFNIYLVRPFKSAMTVLRPCYRKIITYLRIEMHWVEWVQAHSRKLLDLFELLRPSNQYMPGLKEVRLCFFGQTVARGDIWLPNWRVQACRMARMLARRVEDSKIPIIIEHAEIVYPAYENYFQYHRDTDLPGKLIHEITDLDRYTPEPDPSW